MKPSFPTNHKYIGFTLHKWIRYFWKGSASHGKNKRVSSKTALKIAWYIDRSWTRLTFCQKRNSHRWCNLCYLRYKHRNPKAGFMLLPVHVRPHPLSWTNHSHWAEDQQTGQRKSIPRCCFGTSRMPFGTATSASLCHWRQSARDDWLGNGQVEHWAKRCGGMQWIPIVGQ